MVISGPMDAKHVGGVNVMSGIQQSGIDSYFKNTTLQPDETPSHTYVEVPERTGTISETLRGPGSSIKRSLSRIRRGSVSQPSNTDSMVALEPYRTNSLSRAASTHSHRSLRMQSSITRLRQRVGLDRDLNTNDPSSKRVRPEPEPVSGPIQRGVSPFRGRTSTSRLTIRSASTASEPETSAAHRPVQRKRPSVRREPSIPLRRPLPPGLASSTLQRPTEREQSSAYVPIVTAASISNQLARPKRVDSGTAIDLKDLPVDERPLGFRAILGVRSFEERMQHYARARHYWAHAEHGLVEWTQAAVAPRVAATRD